MKSPKLSNFEPSPIVCVPGNPLPWLRRTSMLTLVCSALVTNLAPQVRAADFVEPHLHQAKKSWMVPEYGGLANSITTDDPPVAEQAVWEGSTFQCGTEEREQISGPVPSYGLTSYENDSGWEPQTLDPVFNKSEMQTIDIMFLYTPEERQRFGQTELEERLLLDIACANEVFRRSQLLVEARLVHIEEASGFKETGKLSTALEWLCSDQTIESLRNQYGADLVSMVMARGEHSGIAVPNGSHSVFCGHPTAFTHEIGHSFGCNHSRKTVSCNRSDSFSFAHVFTLSAGGGHTYGTIMSYVGSLILNFSNPQVSFLGHPTGQPEGHRDESGYHDSADNARTITLAAPEVAARKTNCVTALKSPSFANTGATFAFDIVAPNREPHSVEYTADFKRWTTLGTYEITDGKTKITDRVESVTARFYRARSGSGRPTKPIGFYQRTVPAGRSLIANQLDNGDNLVGRLFEGAPEGTALYKWNAFIQDYEENILQPSGWTQPTMSLHPGEGAVIQNDQPLTLTFVGHVRPAVYQPIDKGWSLVSSPVPQAGRLSSELGFPVGGAGQTYKIVKSTNGFETDARWICTSGTWQDNTEPEVEIGEAFWSFGHPNAHIWERVLIPWTGEIVLKVAHVRTSSVELRIQGEPGAVYRIEGSADLVHWTPLTTLTNVVADLSWTDPEAGSSPCRFYRVIQISR